MRWREPCPVAQFRHIAIGPALDPLRHQLRRDMLGQPVDLAQAETQRDVLVEAALVRPFLASLVIPAQAGIQSCVAPPRVS